eukprot:m.106673 g.106673  ORF g.106673 m.106673 type:complete len:137 (+) comp15159_c1_seq2:48-458(+)
MQICHESPCLPSHAFFSTQIAFLFLCLLVCGVTCLPSCLQGHSVEQFRIYEAIESGSIPVICYEQNYVREYLPPEMIHSPIVFVHTWEEAAEKMMSLYQNPAALLSRQIALVTWYDDYMRARVSDVESILEQKMSE